MSNTPGFVSDSIGPLVEPLHESFEWARHQLKTRFDGLMLPEQDWLRTHNLRGLTYQALSAGRLPDRWTLTGDHRRNGATHLTFGSGEIVIRSVHVFPSGTAPVAGTNRARRAYYTNRALSEFDDQSHMPTHRMLLTWEEGGPDSEFLLDILRPLEPGRLGRSLKCDVRFPLPRVRSDFETLSFDTHDEAESLEFELDERDLGNE